MEKTHAAPRPTAAFVLSLIGGGFTVLYGPLVSLFFRTPGEALLSSLVPVGPSEASFMPFVLLLYGLGVACGAVMILGALMQNSAEKPKVKRGSLVVLAGLVASGPFTFFGAGLGGILALAGAILGLAWART